MKLFRYGQMRLLMMAVAALLILAAGQLFAAQNVILIIGDGMGFEHVKAGSYYATGQAGQLAFEQYYKCSVTTYPLGGGVTDSAAAGTAMATGHKVPNGVISQASNGSPYTTILEYAKSMGKSTGIVSTVSIADATPAAFGAHEPSRSNITNIINDYLYGSKPNIIFGGGSGSWSSSQISIAQSLGYQYVTNYAQMAALSPTTQYALGLFASGDMTYEYDRLPSNPEPHLSQMASTALSILSNDPDGFFLMLEGGSIDHASHSNDLNRVTREVVELNNTFQVVMNWVQTHPDTLVIVTADHETGGLYNVINRGAGNYPTGSWSSGGHTGANVPFYATGANNNLVNKYIVSGVIDNTNIFQIMYEAFQTPIPEPSTLLVLAGGFAGFLGISVRRRLR